MDNKIPLGKLAFGIVLLVVGVVGFTDVLDRWDVREIVQYWPVLLIFLGVSSEIDALRQRKSGSGYVLIAVGVWLLVAMQNYFGLTARGALPLAIAVVGLGVIVHALVDTPAPAKKENGND